MREDACRNLPITHGRFATTPLSLDFAHQDATRHASEDLRGRASANTFCPLSIRNEQLGINIVNKV
jgi:hypothetical protein